MGKQCILRSEEQSDQGLHCLPFHLHFLGALLYGITSLLDFRVNTAKSLPVRKCINFLKVILFLLLLYKY